MSNVTPTSKAAYYHTNLTNQRGSVAEYLLQRTFAGRLTSDKDVERATGIPASRVSARRDELFETRYFSHGVWWIPAQMANRYDRQTQCTVQTWAMVVWSDAGNMLDMKRDTLNFITNYKMK